MSNQPIAPIPGWGIVPGGFDLHGAMGTVKEVASLTDPTVHAAWKYPKEEVLRTMHDPEELAFFLGRFEEETYFLQQVSGPFVPRVYASGRFPHPIHGTDVPYVVLENLGAAIGHWNVYQRELPVALRAFVGVLQVLHLLIGARGSMRHDGNDHPVAGIEHRDIKKENVLVTPDGRVVLLDFGLARWANDPREKIALSRAGTPSMMAPELLSEELRTKDRRADLYSAGAFFDELLSESPLYPGDDHTQILASMLTMPAPAPLHVRAPHLVELLGQDAAEALSDVVARLTEREVTVRTQHPWDALVGLAAINPVVSLLGASPLAFPFNSDAMRSITVGGKLLRLTGAAPSELLANVVSTLKVDLDRAWHDGGIAPGRDSVTVDWPKLVQDPSVFERLPGSLAAVSAFLRSLRAACGAKDAASVRAAFAVVDIEPARLDEALRAWASVEQPPLDALPDLRAGIASVAERAGRYDAAFELVRDDPSNAEQYARLSLELRRPDAHVRINALPRTSEGVRLRAEMHVRNTDVMSVLNETNPKQLPDGTFQERAEILARRILATRFYLRAVLDTHDEPLARARIEEVRAMFQDEPKESWPPSLHIAFGVIAADEGKLEEMQAHFAYAASKVAPGALADRYRMAEAEYLAFGFHWKSKPSPDLAGSLVESASRALALAELLHDPGRLQNALTNRIEARMREVGVVHLEQLSANKAISLGAVEQALSDIEAMSRRLELLIAGQPYAHELTRRLQLRRAALARIAVQLADDEAHVAQAATLSSTEGIGEVRATRVGIIALVNGRTLGATDVVAPLELSLEIVRAMSNATTADEALRIALDTLIRHFRCVRGSVYWGPAGARLDEVLHRISRTATIGPTGDLVRIEDLDDEPPSSRGLRALFLESSEGQIVTLSDARLSASQSSMMLGNERYLGAGLHHARSRRGVLIFVANPDLRSRMFTLEDAQILTAISAPLAGDLARADALLALRQKQSVGFLRALGERTHDVKNTIGKASASIDRVFLSKQRYERASDQGDATEADAQYDNIQHELVISDKFIEEAKIQSTTLLGEFRSREASVDEGAYDRAVDIEPGTFVRDYLQQHTARREALGAPRDLYEFCLSTWEVDTRSDDHAHITLVFVPQPRPEDFPDAAFDPAGLGSFLTNAIQNALYHLRRDGGSLILELAPQHDRIDITVRDTGPGIGKDLLELLVRGFTTKPKGVGHGFGIPTMISIAKEHFGTIRIAGVPGEGTAITLTLPLGPPLPDQAAKLLDD